MKLDAAVASNDGHEPARRRGRNEPARRRVLVRPAAAVDGSATGAFAAEAVAAAGGGGGGSAAPVRGIAVRGDMPKHTRALPDTGRQQAAAAHAAQHKLLGVLVGARNACDMACMHESTRGLCIGACLVDPTDGQRTQCTMHTVHEHASHAAWCARRAPCAEARSRISWVLLTRSLCMPRRTNIRSPASALDTGMTCCLANGNDTLFGQWT
eukprot:365219-Chlamydomonas_euryale.AAC.36